MKTRNGITIEVPESTLAHLEAHKDVKFKDVEEAIGKVNYDGEFFKGAIDLGRTVGKTGCVRVNSNDKVLYYRRKNRHGDTPFVKGRKPEATNKVVVIMEKDRFDPSRHILITTWYGELAPMEPWDARYKNLPEEEIQKCDEFWSTHALIYDPSVIEDKAH